MESSPYQFATIEGRKRCSLINRSIFHLNQRDSTKPLSVFLVKSGSSGNHLLFRYPFEVPGNSSITDSKNGGTNSNVRRNNSIKDGSTIAMARNVPSRNGQPQQQQPSQQGIKRGISRMDSSPISDNGDKVVDTISKCYGLNDTMTNLTRDKLNTVIKSINPAAVNEDNQELFPPVVTAPTIPESVIVDNQDQSEDKDEEDGLLKPDPFIVQVIGLSDSVLTDLFAVKSALCGQKFEVKINNIRFVGHPIAITNNSSELTTLNIVFALKANSSHDIVNCYHEVSHRLSISLLAEETRCGYLSTETEDMLKLHRFDETHDRYDEEYDAEVEQINSGTIGTIGTTSSGNNFTCGSIPESPEGANVEFARKGFKIECLNNILMKNKLASSLKQVFDDITISGTTSVLINDSSLISFCLPQKVHQLLRSTHIRFHSSHNIPTIGPSEITKALELLRPFHGILLLNDYSKLLDSNSRISLTAAVNDPRKVGGIKNNVEGTKNTGTIGTLGNEPLSDTIKIVTSIKPTKTLLDLSKEINLSLAKIFHVVSSLVYWGKGFIIYPICLSNVYSIHPLANTGVNVRMITEFASTFPGQELLKFLSFFERGISVKQLQKVTGYNNSLLVNQLIWCLRNRLLLQLHTYVYYLNSADFKSTNPNELDHPSPKSFGSSPTIKLSQEYYSCDEDEEDEDEENYLISRNQQVVNKLISSPKIINKSSFNCSPNLRVSENVFRSLLDTFEQQQQQQDSKQEFMNDKEKESILKVAIESNVSIETFEQFLRLKEHFDGTRHLEDIMFHEGIDRKCINCVIDSFESLLCTSQCEDRAVAQLCPYFQTYN